MAGCASLWSHGVRCLSTPLEMHSKLVPDVDSRCRVPTTFGALSLSGFGSSTPSMNSNSMNHNSTTCACTGRKQRHRRVHLLCKAAPGTASPQDPAGPTPSSSDASTGRTQWGSSWSKRAGSVFRKPSEGLQSNQPTSNTASHARENHSSKPAEPESEKSEQLDPQLEASIRMSVERASQTLQDIVKEVMEDLLVEEASAYVLGQQQAELELRQAVRNAVVKRLEWLDSNFLAAVNAYLTLPTVRNNPELADLLQAVRQETLRLVSARLPAQVQVLNAALMHSRRTERSSIIEQALAGGQGDVPGSSLDAMGAAAHQLIDDIEDQQVVADRVLLARLVLVREELRRLAEQQSAEQFWQQVAGGAGEAGEAAPHPSPPGAGQDQAGASSSNTSSSPSASHQPFFTFNRSNLPARCAAFLKNLLAVHDRNTRLGVLSKAFNEDWIAEQSPSKGDAAGGCADSQPSFSQQRAQMRDTNFGPEQKQEAPDVVRPGRLLTTLHAMKQELEAQLVSAGPDNPAGAEAMGLLRRLHDIHLEALVALDRVQHSRSTEGTAASASAGGSSARSGLLDYELELEEHAAAAAASE